MAPLPIDIGGEGVEVALGDDDRRCGQDQGGDLDLMERAPAGFGSGRPAGSQQLSDLAGDEDGVGVQLGQRMEAVLPFDPGHPADHLGADVLSNGQEQVELVEASAEDRQPLLAEPRAVLQVNGGVLADQFIKQPGDGAADPDRQVLLARGSPTEATSGGP